MKIGLLSDTHGHLDKSIFKYFKECDEIWHAGDIGTEDLLDELAGFKPTRPVWGNIDSHNIRIRTTENQIFEVEGKKVLITHIAGKPPKYDLRVRKLISIHRPNILVCGHSHILRIENDKKNDILFINPGAAGIYGLHKVKTILRFEIEKNKIFDMEVIELGPRARI